MFNKWLCSDRSPTLCLNKLDNYGSGSWLPDIPLEHFPKYSDDITCLNGAAQKEEDLCKH